MKPTKQTIGEYFMWSIETWKEDGTPDDPKIGYGKHIGFIGPGDCNAVFEVGENRQAQVPVKSGRFI